MKKNKPKRYRIKPRFYCLILTILILGSLGYRFYDNVNANELPNFYGWLSEDVMEFEEEHSNLSIIYELVYSENVRPARVVSQSVQPGTELNKEPIVLTVQVSKGKPVNH